MGKQRTREGGPNTGPGRRPAEHYRGRARVFYPLRSSVRTDVIGPCHKCRTRRAAQSCSVYRASSIRGPIEFLSFRVYNIIYINRFFFLVFLALKSISVFIDIHRAIVPQWDEFQWRTPYSGKYDYYRRRGRLSFSLWKITGIYLFFFYLSVRSYTGHT